MFLVSFIGYEFFLFDFLFHDGCLDFESNEGNNDGNDNVDDGINVEFTIEVSDLWGIVGNKKYSSCDVGSSLESSDNDNHHICEAV